MFGTAAKLQKRNKVGAAFLPNIIGTSLITHGPKKDDYGKIIPYSFIGGADFMKTFM